MNRLQNGVVLGPEIKKKKLGLGTSLQPDCWRKRKKKKEKKKKKKKKKKEEKEIVHGRAVGGDSGDRLTPCWRRAPCAPKRRLREGASPLFRRGAGGWRRAAGAPFRTMGQGGWNIRLSRNSNDWELDALGELLYMLRDLRISLEEDAVIWKGEGHGRFQIRDAYKLLTGSNDITFPNKSIWVDKVPTKVAFFAWEASWEKVLTLDKLQRRGWQLPNQCFLCGCEEENVNHILLHCTVVRPLWEIVLALFGVNWVFPEKVKEMLVSWRGPFVGRKRKRIWTSIPLCIFWTVWKERNRLAFRGGSLAIQKLKNSFVCNLWSWARVYMGEESSSLLGFLEWLAIP
ncbi:hypothetical protein CK203_013954 [Vitis vinifera]|uniref:Reverse transcriptase zinc-binding domain-containing protein n=1 Tax=Vitis vinifera TaxID=29760 RepID=A0A438JJC0_VITVI|nr:hypothetical protein CK203_013954 [Vitis vinifera]